MERSEIQLRTEREGVVLRVYSSLGIDWPFWTRLPNRSRSETSTTRSRRRSNVQFKRSISSLEERRVCYSRLPTRSSSSIFNNKRSLPNSLLLSSSTSFGVMMEIWLLSSVNTVSFPHSLSRPSDDFRIEPRLVEQLSCSPTSNSVDRTSFTKLFESNQEHGMTLASSCTLL